MGEPRRLKLVVVGDSAVGKTCFLTRGALDSFPTHYIPTVFQSHVSFVRVDGKGVELALWDTGTHVRKH